MVSPKRTTRKALHERSSSQTNALAAVRLVPYTPPLLSDDDDHLRDNDRDHIYSRTPLPTSSAHIFPPTSSNLFHGAGREDEARTTDQGFPTALNWTDDDVSHQHLPAKLQTLSGSGSSTPQLLTTPTSEIKSRDVSSTLNKAKPLLKKRKHVAVDPRTKTFKVLDATHQNTPDNLTARLRSPASITSLASHSSHGELSLDGHDIEDPPNSSASCIPESPIATSASSTPKSKPTTISNNCVSTTTNVSNSPWNYSLVGGLRKVPKTPDLKKKVSQPLAYSPPPPIPETPEAFRPYHDLSSKPSFQSQNTVSTSSETTNYKIYGESAASSPYPATFSNEQRTVSSSRPQTADVTHSSSEVEYTSSEAQSDQNYQLHGNPSPAQSTAELPQLKSEYSQESLIVAPLQTRPRESAEVIRHWRTQSRETTRTRAGSLNSISTVLSQREATRAIAGTGSLINLPPTLRTSIVWAGTGGLNLPRNLMQAHPHQWSSQLSTVPSESENGSARGSRTWSEARRSSGVVSPLGRGVASNASSHGLSDSLSRSDSRSESLDRIERPQPAFLYHGHRENSNSTIRMVDEEDEEGDVVTDMPDMLRSRPSRQRLSGLFGSSSSDDGRTNTMRSTTSSRANSLITSSIPTWAKLYYGSGERKYLGAPGSSTEGTDSRPASLWSRSGSPDTANFPLSVYSPRRRPRETSQRNVQRESLEINPVPIRHDSIMHSQHQWARRLRSRTSSIWSPHLQTDRRAARQSVWNPPASSWSADNRSLGRSNRQLVMFIVGFIFPFCKSHDSSLSDNITLTCLTAWMIAAILPLPPNPSKQAMLEGDHSQEDLSAEDRYRTSSLVDQKHYLSAKWWRGLNRWMSFVGIAIIAAIVSRCSFNAASAMGTNSFAGCAGDNRHQTTLGEMMSSPSSHYAIVAVTMFFCHNNNCPQTLATLLDSLWPIFSSCEHILVCSQPI